MIGECQVMSPADKYAAYLKGFEPISFKRNKRGMYYFSESFGAAAAIYTSGKKVILNTNCLYGAVLATCLKAAMFWPCTTTNSTPSCLCLRKAVLE